MKIKASESAGKSNKRVAQITADLTVVLEICFSKIEEKLNNQQQTTNNQIKYLIVTTTDVESRITSIKGMSGWVKRPAALQSQVKTLSEKLEDLDNRDHRILRLPEGTKGKYPTKYLETWILEALDSISQIR